MLLFFFSRKITHIKEVSNLHRIGRHSKQVIQVIWPFVIWYRIYIKHDLATTLLLGQLVRQACFLEWCLVACSCLVDTLGSSDCAHQLVLVAQPNYHTCQLMWNAERVWHAVTRQMERSLSTGWHFTACVHERPGGEGLAARVRS